VQPYWNRSRIGFLPDAINYFSSSPRTFCTHRRCMSPMAARSAWVRVDGSLASPSLRGRQKCAPSPRKRSRGHPHLFLESPGPSTSVKPVWDLFAPVISIRLSSSEIQSRCISTSEILQIVLKKKATIQSWPISSYPLPSCWMSSIAERVLGSSQGITWYSLRFKI
jgi:hypothetical protein